MSEVEQLKQRVADLQSQQWVTCVYCGHRYGPDDGSTPVSHAEVLKRHIAKCPEHPMAELVLLVRECHEALVTLCQVQPIDAMCDLRDRLQSAIRRAEA